MSETTLSGLLKKSGVKGKEFIRVVGIYLKNESPIRMDEFKELFMALRVSELKPSDITKLKSSTLIVLQKRKQMTDLFTVSVRELSLFLVDK